MRWVEYLGFLVLVVAALALGGVGGLQFPWLAAVCGAALLFAGVTACLAYMFLDVERYEVSRGYKAMHNPLKGQELAVNLIQYGHRVGVLLLGGFRPTALPLQRPPSARSSSRDSAANARSVR